MGPQLSLLVILALLSMALAIGGAAQDVVPGNSTSSPWLDRIIHHRRRHGCRSRPWICRDRLDPFRRRLCCKNRCVDVGSDPNNCGLCRFRCPFRWQCCGGFCADTMWNPFHCGDCTMRCPFGTFCLFGLCGYAERSPPFPFPHPSVRHSPPSPHPWPPPPVGVVLPPPRPVEDTEEHPMIGTPELD